MANPTTYGLSSVTYGTLPYTGFVVQSYTLAVKDGVLATVLNETGQEVVRRYDDQINELSLDMIVNGGSIPVPGQTLTYNSIVYEIQTCDLKAANKDFNKVSVKCKNSANITS